LEIKMPGVESPFIAEKNPDVRLFTISTLPHLPIASCHCVKCHVFTDFFSANKKQNVKTPNPQRFAALTPPTLQNSTLASDQGILVAKSYRLRPKTSRPALETAFTTWVPKLCGCGATV